MTIILSKLVERPDLSQRAFPPIKPGLLLGLPNNKKIKIIGLIEVPRIQTQKAGLTNLGYLLLLALLADNLLPILASIRTRRNIKYPN